MDNFVLVEVCSSTTKGSSVEVNAGVVVLIFSLQKKNGDQNKASELHVHGHAPLHHTENGVKLNRSKTDL